MHFFAVERYFCTVRVHFFTVRVDVCVVRMHLWTVRTDVRTVEGRLGRISGPSDTNGVTRVRRIGTPAPVLPIAPGCTPRPLPQNLF